jgi:phosphomannomutase
MEATTKAVLENKADLGICFDTDVDRSGRLLFYSNTGLIFLRE